MPDQFTTRLQDLVAEPPPFDGVPSEAVAARVRAARRRRGAGAALLATATVAAIAVAADTLSTADPSAPVAGVPGSPSTVATGSPTSTPTPTVKPLEVAVSLKPEVTGRRLRLQITVSGTALSPVTADGQALPADTAFADYSLGSEYSLGDGAGGGGSDGGTVTCTGAKRRVTGRTVHWVVDAPYTYRRPGTYTITYKIDFCGPKGQFTVTKATKVTVK